MRRVFLVVLTCQAYDKLLWA